MYVVFVVIVWTVFAIRFVDWKNTSKYYSTILYYDIMNLTYDFLYYNHTLFAFKAITTKYLNHTLISLVFYFFIMPIIIVIFLQRYPEQWKDKILYILAWALFFWVIECIFASKGMFVYDNGWNIWHSAWFDIMIFILLINHYRWPFPTMALTLIGIVIFTVLFPIPLSSMK